MIYARPDAADPIDQGDIISGCPLYSVVGFSPEHPEEAEAKRTPAVVYVLTQTCDLANAKASRATVALLRDARELVASGSLKAADIRGPVRSGRVYGWYFLPKSSDFGLAESLVDLRSVHTVRLDLLDALSRQGQRLVRLLTPYREHLAQHFAITYSRIGLPQPYPSD